MNSNIKSIAYILLFLNTSNFFGQTNDPPAVTAVGNQIYCPQSQQRIVTFFDIVDTDDTTIDAFYIQISSGYVSNEDRLALIGNHPNIESIWNPDEAKLTLTGLSGGSASYTDIIAAVYDVVFSSAIINASAKTFSLTVGSANYLVSTDHYYEFVAANVITWTNAKTAAEARTYFGLQGYLATLASADEAQIAGELAPGTGWIGASDQGSEGVWKWMTGPEAGSPFWNGNENGSIAAGMYANWNSGEPNNYDNNEDYAHIKDDAVQGLAGSWNDLPNNTTGQPSNYQAKGYVVEYGGMPGDPTLTISASTTFSPPQILSTTAPVSCINETANLEATSNTDDIEWYDSETGGPPIARGFSFNPVLTSDTTFWVLASNNGCSNGIRTAINATVNPNPVAAEPSPYSLCDVNTDGTLSDDGLALFDLSTKKSEILNGQTGVDVTFHANSSQALAGSNPLDLFTNTTPGFQKIFVRLENTSTNCHAITTLDLKVLPIVSPTFDLIDPICSGEILTLPTTSNEGITGTWSPAIDNTLTAEYTFIPTTGECATEATLRITVIPLLTPLFTQVNTICVGDILLDLPLTSNNNITGSWSPAINNTSTTEYTFTPNSGLSCVPQVKMTITVLTPTVPEFTQVNPICIGDRMTLLPQRSNNGITGTWFPPLNNVSTTTYTFSSDPGQCADATTMTIVVNTISTLTINATNTSEDFDSNQVISVTATGGSGDYEYQLDGGVWQSNSTFEYVTGCEEHTVAVKDALGCSTIPEKTLMIMEFPKFFTPNGDGYNDTWNIKCLKDNPLAKVIVFDRFGKLLLLFRPDQNNWDGTFNGQLLPESDYWFIASYLNSNGVATKFRSHFTLRH